MCDCTPFVDATPDARAWPRCDAVMATKLSDARVALNTTRLSYLHASPTEPTVHFVREVIRFPPGGRVFASATSTASTTAKIVVFIASPLISIIFSLRFCLLCTIFDIPSSFITHNTNRWRLRMYRIVLPCCFCAIAGCARVCVCVCQRLLLGAVYVGR